MADIRSFAGLMGFGANPSRLAWDKRSGSVAGSAPGDGSPVRQRVGLYGAGGGDIIINQAGPPVRVQINNNSIDVNFETLESCLVASYPRGATMPNNTPIMVTFGTPVGGVGAYLSIIGDPILYDGRALHGIMWVLLQGDSDWKLTCGDGITGRSVAHGSFVSAPFVGALGANGAKIEQVCFDASLAGNFDKLVLSNLFWTP